MRNFLEQYDKLSESDIDLLVKRANSIDENFWNNFIKIIGSNPKQSALLFGIKEGKISDCIKRLKDSINRIKNSDEFKTKSTKRIMFHTGN